jgi:hypothetical protein
MRATSGDQMIRDDVAPRRSAGAHDLPCIPAIAAPRLGPAALMLLHAARSPRASIPRARCSCLRDQDRGKWDHGADR